MFKPTILIHSKARHHPFHARPVPRAGLCGEHGVSLVHHEKRQKLTTSQGLPSRRKLTIPHSPNLCTKKVRLHYISLESPSGALSVIYATQRGAVHKDSKQQQLSESPENALFKARYTTLEC